MKSLIGDDKLRVHVKLISGETLLARVDTEHGSIKNIEIFGSIDPLNEEVMRRSGKLIFDGDEIHFTGALYLDEFTIIRLVQSKDPVQGFVKSWNKEIRYEGISFESKLKSFIFNIGTGFFSIHDFFVNIGEACPLEEISGEFCSGGSASSSHSGSKVKTYNVTSDFANVCDEMDEKGPGGFWGQCLYTIKYDYCVEFKGIVDKEKCECECVTKATSALGKSLNDKFNKLSNEHEKEQVSTMMRQSMERRKAQHWIVQTK
jgi:hypothetical protein